MATTYYFNVFGVVGVPARITILTDRINEDMELPDATSVVYNGVTDEVEVTFPSALTDFQVTILDNITRIVLYDFIPGENIYVRDLNDDVRHSYGISTPPGPQNDVKSGYTIGSMAVDSLGGVFVNVQNTEDSAVWVSLLSSVSVNNTLYVDEQYGTTSGTYEDMSRPYLTVQDAILDANPGDIIYVRPGTYFVDNLSLAFNYYLEYGVNFITTTNPTFNDIGGPYVSFVLGYGNITSDNAIVSITTNSSIIVKGELFDISGGEMFSLISATTKCVFNVTALSMVASGTGEILFIDGPAEATISCDYMASSSVIIDIEVNARNFAIINTRHLAGGDSAAGSISVASPDFNLTMTSNLFVPTSSLTQAIRVFVPGVGTGNLYCQFNFQTLETADGGVLFVEGEPIASTINQPSIILIIDKLRVNSGVSVFDIATSRTSINVNEFSYNMTSAITPIFEFRTDAVVKINVEKIFGGGSNPTLFNFTQPLANNEQFCDINFKQINVFSQILNTSGLGNLILKGNDIHTQINVADVKAFILNGEITIDCNLITINISVVPTLPPLNMIDVISGNTIFNVGRVIPTSTDCTIINTNAGTSFIAEMIAIVDSAPFSFGSYMLNLSGNNTLSIEALISVSGKSIMNITDGTLTYNGKAMVVISGVGNVFDVTNSGISVEVLSLMAESGSLINSNSTGTIRINSEEIVGEGGTPGAVSGTFMLFDGDGDVYIRSNSISANYYSIVMQFGTASSGCLAAINCDDIIMQEADQFVVTNIGSGGLNLTFQTIRCNTVNVDLFDYQDAGINLIMGGHIQANTVSGVIFRVQGSASFQCTLISVDCPCTVLYLTTDTNAYYNSQYTIVNSFPNAAVIIDAPIDTVTHTFSGYISCAVAGSDGIQIIGAVTPRLRLMNMILVASASSIYNAIAGNVDISINTVTTNVATTGLITFYPAANFVVDPGVF